jgi:hypothetical protein
MVNFTDARRLALSFPEAVEQDHHGFPSFRVAKKIFATVPDEETFHVMLGPDETDVAVSTAPLACEELWWGERLAGVRVKLAAVDPDLLAGLLTEAWRRKAPRRLLSLVEAP